MYRLLKINSINLILKTSYAFIQNALYLRNKIKNNQTTAFYSLYNKHYYISLFQPK